MAIEDIRKMMAVGIPAEAAKVVDEVVTTASGGAVAWADVTGAQAGVEAAVAAKTSVAALVALTDNSGGTANDTVEAVPAATAATTDNTAASLISTNAAIDAIKNDIADLAAKVNAVIAALK